MADLVTLEETKLFLRVTHPMEDTMIATLIGAASEAVLTLADGWDGVGEVPARLKLAVLGRVAVAFEDRTDVRAAIGEDRLIGPYRSMTV